MVIAWYLLGFFGLLVARYAKDIDKDFCGKDLWFRLHQICMITTWILVMIGKNCLLIINDATYSNTAVHL